MELVRNISPSGGKVSLEHASVKMCNTLDGADRGISSFKGCAIHAITSAKNCVSYNNALVIPSAPSVNESRGWSMYSQVHNDAMLDLYRSSCAPHSDANPTSCATANGPSYVTSHAIPCSCIKESSAAQEHSAGTPSGSKLEASSCVPQKASLREGRFPRSEFGTSPVGNLVMEDLRVPVSLVSRASCVDTADNIVSRCLALNHSSCGTPFNSHLGLTTGADRRAIFDRRSTFSAFLSREAYAAKRVSVDMHQSNTSSDSTAPIAHEAKHLPTDSAETYRNVVNICCCTVPNEPCKGLFHQSSGQLVNRLARSAHLDSIFSEEELRRIDISLLISRTQEVGANYRSLSFVCRYILCSVHGKDILRHLDWRSYNLLVVDTNFGIVGAVEYRPCGEFRKVLGAFSAGQLVITLDSFLGSVSLENRDLVEIPWPIRLRENTIALVLR